MTLDLLNTDTLNDPAVESVARLAQFAAAPAELETGKVYLVHNGDGTSRLHDLTGDTYRDTPRRKTGTTTVRDVASFLAYWGKHSYDQESEIYADRDTLRLTAVLDGHGPHGADPGWCQHRLVLQLRHSDAWQAWASASGRMLSQLAFAEFIEDHRADVRDPSAADLLEMAQEFHATKNVTFKAGALLKSGQRKLQYVEQIDASAGQRGDIVIPDAFDLALAVFDGATEAEQVTARLRYRIDTDGRLGLGFVLDQLTDVVAAAFEGVVAEVTAGVTVPVLRGTPAA